MENLLLSINHVTVTGSSGAILIDLSFILSAGQQWAITGESGSGKTTLLKTIAGRVHITQGSIDYHFLKPPVDGDDTSPLKLSDCIAMVDAKHHFKNLANVNDLYYQQRFNSSDSEDALTVQQYLETVKPGPLTNDYWDIENTAQLLGLTELLSKQIIKLSNGESKRLLIAAALLKNPVLLLMDNPLTGLDIQTRGEFDALINKIVLSGVSIVLATSPYELPAAITNVAVMKKGEIVKVIAKNQFHPFQETKAGRGIDEAELKQLLRSSAQKINYNYIVDIKGATVKYGEKTILDKINWQISPGERWALLGPNGAGKSTLLSLINGDNPQAYANKITLFDRKRGTGESIWDIKSKIGFVSPELYQYFPADNNCLQAVESGFYDTIGLFRPSVKENAERTLKWMQVLNIDKYAHRPLRNLPASSQRLCLLARAMVKTPRLLIFDEPCQGMDEEQQLHFKNILDTICRLSNITLIYVTHYQHEIPESVTKVLKLEMGRVV